MSLTALLRRRAPRCFHQAQAEFCSVGGNICETPYKNAFTLAEIIWSTGLANGSSEATVTLVGGHPGGPV
jgi:hypothetical protein